jgi:hypothetical protein
MNNARCTHLLNNPYGQLLTLTFDAFVTELNYDYFSVSSGVVPPWSYTAPASLPLPEFNGGQRLSGVPTVPFTVVTAAQEVGLFFQADTSGTRSGVTVTVAAAPSAPGAAQPPAALDVDLCAQPPGGGAVDLPADTWVFLSTSSAAGGGNVFNTDGQICDFTVNNPQRALLSVDFLAFDLLAGDTFSVSPLLAPRTGSVAPPDLTTSEPALNFSFASDKEGYSRGVAVRVGPAGRAPPAAPAPRLAPPRGASDGAAAAVVAALLALAGAAGAAGALALRRGWPIGKPPRQHVTVAQ